MSHREARNKAQQRDAVDAVARGRANFRQNQPSFFKNYYPNAKRKTLKRLPNPGFDMGKPRVALSERAKARARKNRRAIAS
mgnify:CR=1 FL=1